MKNVSLSVYDPDMIEQIEENVDLLEYVSNSIELEQRGNDYFGHCPLHVDKTPSFSVNPKENKYYCFSCGYGGRIISYLCDYEKMSYEFQYNPCYCLSLFEQQYVPYTKPFQYNPCYCLSLYSFAGIVSSS